MTTRFRLSNNGRQHHLMVNATTRPENVAPGLLDTELALSLVLGDDDLSRLRAAVQTPDATVLKTRLADMTNSYGQVKKARENDKARIAALHADHARAVSQLRLAHRAHDDSQIRDATTISKLTTEVSTLKKAVENAERNQRAAEIGRQEYKDALAEQKKQYSNLRLEHRALSDSYQRMIRQNAKFLATASRPTFFFDASGETDRLRAELKTARGERDAARAERDAARADARSSKAAVYDLIVQWEKP
ncbi:hypothetical protein ACFYN0_26795 [Streptomyces sp. NPDC006704]|uniref:hypothetical protein n=1 Tax=Streptomyces sp. NPDC006704 TaxID=3364760 RepID=UPI0036739593